MNKCHSISDIFTNNPGVISISLVAIILCIVFMIMLAIAQHRGGNLKSGGIVVLSKYKYYKEAEFKRGGKTIKYYTPIFVGKVNGFEYEFALEHVLEKPEFKEKIRLRSYGLATEESPVFLELKRKAYGIVYKRRVETTIPLVKKFFSGEGDICAPGQINREITAFRDHYKTLVPACLIIYDRTAYFESDGDLRLTIDENPRYRLDGLTLTRSMDGISLLDEGWTILEIKVQEAVPLWLCDILSAGGIRKGSFSKYGEAYRQQLLKAQNY